MHMRLHDGTELTPETIEEINAHGPFTMAVWRSGEVSVGNEEGLTGRSAYFTRLIRRSILKYFTPEQLKTMSILDIGCNDGWVLHELSDLPFAKMVGIEPREKNIRKGKAVRSYLRLENRVDYRVGDIESLGDESFDIVVCAGVLYHVESIPVALRRIRSVCRQLLFVESRCISSKHITEELRQEIEMRDLVYQFKDKLCGVTAQKFESAYHDSSAHVTTIVNVPSTESLVMNLQILGFHDIDVVADPDTYRAEVWGDKRPLGGVCLTARLGAAPRELADDEGRWIEEYERGLAAEILPREYVEPLYRVFCGDAPADSLAGAALATREYLIGQRPDFSPDVLPANARTRYATEIVQNWRYSPRDKIALEYGKLLCSEARFDEALSVLKSITSRLNADWRAAYRSFALMATVLERMQRAAEAKRYRELCVSCNPKYPLA